MGRNATHPDWPGWVLSFVFLVFFSIKLTSFCSNTRIWKLCCFETNTPMEVAQRIMRPPNNMCTHIPLNSPGRLVFNLASNTICDLRQPWNCNLFYHLIRDCTGSESEREIVFNTNKRTCWWHLPNTLSHGLGQKQPVQLQPVQVAEQGWSAGRFESIAVMWK